MITIKWFYKINGNYVHVRVYTGLLLSNLWMQNGNLIFNVSDWTEIINRFYNLVEFIEDLE